jgi:regulatory protein YycI of two-component signal transduction system YycFG
MIWITRPQGILLLTIHLLDIFLNNLHIFIRIQSSTTRLVNVATRFDANSFTHRNINNVNRIATEIDNIASRLTDMSLNVQGGNQHQMRF